MQGFNRISLLGNLTRDPILRRTQSDTAVADINIAVNRRTKDGESVFFISVVAWKEQAEAAAQYLKKGAPVFVDGYLEHDEYTGVDDKKISKLRAVANRIIFLPSGKNQAEADAEMADGTEDSFRKRLQPEQEQDIDPNKLPF